MVAWNEVIAVVVGNKWKIQQPRIIDRKGGIKVDIEVSGFSK